MKSALFTTLLATPLAISVGCGDGDDGHHGTADAAADCSEETRDDEFFAGMSKTGPAGYVVTLVDALPSPPGKTDNVWTVAVTDPEGEPATTIDLVPRLCMPDHDHGTPIVPVVTPDGAGGFTIDPINFWMPTLWEVELLVREPGADDELPGVCQPVPESQRIDAVTFRFCLDG